MTLIKNNAKRILVLFLALVASLGLMACDKKDKEVEQQLKDALATILVPDTSTLNNSFTLPDKTRDYDLTITWEVICEDGTAKLETVDGKQQVTITQTEYSEDAQGNQTNGWGEGTLKATVTIGDKSSSRSWELHILPGVKETELTVAAAKAAANDTVVEIQGVVTYVISAGFYVQDETGSMYVYNTPSENIKLGAVVKVQGKKITYNTQPEIDKNAKIDLVTKAPETGYDYSKATVVEIKEIVETNRTELSNYGKIVKITGQVIKGYKNDAGDSVSDYAIKDTVNDATLAIYNSSNDAVKAELEAKVGKYVSVVVIVHDFHSTQLVWRALGVAGTVEDAQAPVLSDEEIVSKAKAELLSKYNNKVYASDLKLIAKGEVGGSITWVSDKPEIIANDGKFYMPSADALVKLTATIKSNDVTDTVELNVTAKNVVKSTVKEAIDAMDAADVDFLMVEGVIVGQDADGYYYLADETAVLYVRHKLSYDNLAVGDKVQVIGKGTVFTNKDVQFTRQISGNYTVKKLDDQKHDSPLAVVDAQISDFDFTIKGTELRTKVPAEELYGKIVRFDAYITIQGTHNNVYLATSLEAGAPSILVYYKSMDQKPLKDIENIKAQVIAVVYDYHTTDGWRLGFLGREGDIVIGELTENQKLAIAKEEIETIVTEGAEVKGNLAVITETAKVTIPGTKYTWTTDDLTTIASDGTFTAPAEDKAVKITVKVFLDGNIEGTPSATYQYNVTAKAESTSQGELTHSFDFGTTDNFGYNDGEDVDKIITNTVTNTDFTFRTHAVQIATSSKYDPHKESGAFAVMGLMRKDKTSSGQSFLEFDLAGQTVSNISFDYSWWSPQDSENAAGINVLALQVWNAETSEWTTLKDFKADLDATVYKTLSYDVTSGTKFRILGQVTAETTNSVNIRITIDNLKIKK